MFTSKSGSAPTKGDLLGEVEGVKIWNTCYTGIEPEHLKLRDPDYSYERKRSTGFNKVEGIYPMTDDELEAERAETRKLVNKFTKKILTMDFTKFSFPVSYSEPRSFLERTADLLVFLSSKYVDMAVAEQNNKKRIMLIATGVCAGFHTYVQSKKPWNPVIGETFVGKWENGAVIYGEQISHHPPVSCFEVYGKDKDWKVHSTCSFTINSGLKSVDIVQSGIFVLSLSDGTIYQWEFPTINVNGIIFGERYIYLKGPVIVTDKTHDIECVVEIGSRGYFSSGQHSLINATIKEKGAIVGKMSGDYTDVIKSDDDVLFDINKDIVQRPSVDPLTDELLYSDSRFRLDRAYLIQGKNESADIAKDLIEQAQRLEEKSRIRLGQQ